MKNLIIGASSKIGKGLLHQNQSDFDFTYFKNKLNNGIKLDITKSIESQVDIKKYENIIILSSITDPKKCAEHRTYSNLLNIVGTKNLINLCLNYNKKIIFFSSDYVFDGNKGSYNEEDEPNPINLYGEQKLEIENYIKKNSLNYTILRIAKTFFNDLVTPCFLKNIFQEVNSNQHEINCIEKQFFTPICVDDISDLIRIIINKKIPLLHVAGPKKVSREDVLKLVMNKLNKNLKINYIERTKLERETKFKWPIDVSLDISRLLKYKKNFLDLNTVIKENV